MSTSGAVTSWATLAKGRDNPQLRRSLRRAG
jgi:hypothetical protein